MANSEYEQQYKRKVIDFFNSRTTYDNDYTIRRAVPLLDLVPFKKGEKVLDIATGTGIIAIAAAQAVGNEGKVIGIDFSAGMLNQAQQKINGLELTNVELIEADAEYIYFDDESFDIIICSTAIVYFKDIPAALKKWHRWLKKGGLLGFSSCSKESCEAPTIISTCAKYGIAIANINQPTGTSENCRNLLIEAEFQDIKITSQQFGFYRSLEQAREWNGGWFHPRENPLLNLPSEQIEKLKVEYSLKIEEKATNEGVWYENLTFFVTGCK
jgi:ubiquinone/menaquinone biosynthesis C-methylase UbiE